MKLKLFFVLSAALAGFSTLNAQDKLTVKYGDVSAKDFANTVYSIDSNASAVVIADVGDCRIDGNIKGWFSMVFHHFKRAHILKKNGYDIADVNIDLYTNGDYEEKLDKLKAVTYNLVDGKVVETKLDTKASVFKDKLNRNFVRVKFTFPNIQEGSIIEFDYTTTSDFLETLEPWEFQGTYPRLWSEFNLAMPEFMSYVFLTQGYKMYDIKTSKDRTENFRIVDSRGTGASENFSFTANVTDYRWVLKNVKGLKEENFTSTLRNHINKIEFQRKDQRPPLVYHEYLGSWSKVTTDLVNNDYFGGQINKDNGWLKDIINPVIGNEKDKMVVARKLYEFVRDNYTCTDHSDWFPNQTLKALVKTRKGAVSEINMLLTALLKHEEIEADPVILSTKAHGYPYPLYPILQKYNYIICQAKIGDQIVYLDATEPNLGFAHLPVRCYNGQGRVINKQATAVDFASDSLQEYKVSTVFIINDEKGNLIGSMTQTPGYYESLDIRDRVKEKGEEELKKAITRDFGMEIEMTSFGIDSLKKPDDPVTIRYEFDIKEEKPDIIYFNPLCGEGYKDNPFKSAERFYPVEMPFATDEIFNLQLDIPQGYVVDEMPKPMIVKLNEQDEGRFEYLVSKTADNISLRVRLRLSRSYFMPEEYEMLREFFNLVVQKEAEQIVFKKKP